MMFEYENTKHIYYVFFYYFSYLKDLYQFGSQMRITTSKHFIIILVLLLTVAESRIFFRRGVKLNITITKFLSKKKKKKIIS